MPDGTTLLMKAAESGRNDIVQELIKLGVDVNQRKSDTFSAFLIACSWAMTMWSRRLQSTSADVNAAYEIGSSQGYVGQSDCTHSCCSPRQLLLCVHFC
jgi:hypothetical protein